MSQRVAVGVLHYNVALIGHLLTLLYRLFELNVNVVNDKHELIVLHQMRDEGMAVVKHNGSSICSTLARCRRESAMLTRSAPPRAHFDDYLVEFCFFFSRMDANEEDDEAVLLN